VLSSSFELRHVASSEGGDVRKAIGGTTSWILRGVFSGVADAVRYVPSLG
jgi:hypothetical protein